MSREFGTFPSTPYIGSPYGQPTSICGVPAEGPQMVPLFFPWLIYGASSAKPNIAAVVSLSGNTGQVKSAISAIRSVYIDNTNNPVPVYVNFPDTNFTVVCPPDSTVFQPVVTNGLTCNVYAAGFTTGNVGETRIYLLNSHVNPFYNPEIQYMFPLEKSSPVIQRGGTIYNSNFSSRALGDQIQSVHLPINTVNVSGALFGGPQAGFLYITSIFIATSACLTYTGQNAPTIQFTSAAEGVIFQCQATCGVYPDSAEYSTMAPASDVLLNVQGANLKFNATDTFTFGVTATNADSGQVTATFVYTISPS